MTPATQRDLLVMAPLLGRRWTWPADPACTSEVISWTALKHEHTQSRNIDELLDDFCGLSAAHPEEMVSFVLEWGVPEVRGTAFSAEHGNPTSVPVSELRRQARAVGAARRLGGALTVRRPGDPQDWSEAAQIAPTFGSMRFDADEIDDWKLGRENFDRLLTMFLVESGVTVAAIWRGTKALAVEPQTPTLLGAVALLLAREVGAEGEYMCDSCGRRVYRSRPPRDGENVYCDRPECKREQRRRNQAKWRAKKRTETGN